MKSLLLALSLTISFLAHAELAQDRSFKPISDYYKNHIGEDEEVFLELRTYEDGKSETNYIVGSLIQEPYYNGLYSIEMTHLLAVSYTHLTLPTTPYV